jgi:hypothetical protein
MILKNLLQLFSDKGCDKVYIKNLSPNDNSKNQVYLGGSFDVLNILPIQDVVSDNSGDWRRMRFKSRLDFYWINDEGTLTHAPETQLILYPKYPEVRLSGFLKGVDNAPSGLMASRMEGRTLLLGVTKTNRIIGYVVPPEVALANELNSLKELVQTGVFREISLLNGTIQTDTRHKLLAELKRIHELGWIDAKRLNAAGETLPCISSNCGGYTLEAELGIKPNGFSEPDYLGWEVKQFAVKSFEKLGSAVITLMTPEPTQGYYVEHGIEAFIRKYGYADKMGREARMNFGGLHKYNLIQPATGLTLVVQGIDPVSRKITDTSGYIGLIDKDGNVAASWAFASLLKHWNRKHANACYVPSMNRKNDGYSFSGQQFCYGDRILLGQNTDFSLFLGQITNESIYYDPGIKLELEIPGVRKQFIKRRSQFRTRSLHLGLLYKSTELITLQ